VLLAIRLLVILADWPIILQGQISSDYATGLGRVGSLDSQVGLDIDGEAACDYSGTFVASFVSTNFLW
jgi:hypothetical protein